MSESLPWLDAANRDDRFLASAIEIMRQHPRSAVTIVTRDINLQSKAELASIPFVEPPDPT
jgi:predicted ribonuclease YlaK